MSSSRNRRKKRNKQHAPQSTNGQDNGRDTGRDADSRSDVDPDVAGRPSVETKPARRTTELVAYVAAVLAVVMTALAVDADGQGSDDPFGTDLAVRLVGLLTLGYVVSRGLAKSGSHENRHGRRLVTADDERADVDEHVIEDRDDHDVHRTDAETTDGHDDGAHGPDLHKAEAKADVSKADAHEVEVADATVVDHVVDQHEADGRVAEVHEVEAEHPEPRPADQRHDVTTGTTGGTVDDTHHGATAIGPRLTLPADPEQDDVATSPITDSVTRP